MAFHLPHVYDNAVAEPAYEVYSFCARTSHGASVTFEKHLRRTKPEPVKELPPPPAILVSKSQVWRVIVQDCFSNCGALRYFHWGVGDWEKKFLLNE